MNKKSVIRIIKLLISICIFFIYYIYAFILKSLNKQAHGTFVVLYYHEIKSIHKKKFSRQMEMLSQYVKPVKSDSVSFTDGEHRVAVTFDDAFQSIIENGIESIYRNRIPITIFVPTAYLGQNPKWELYGNSKISRETIMTRKQLLSLSPELVTLGSHTCTHPDLTKLSSEEIELELKKSKNDLEKLINRRIDLLAFPHGEYNEKIIRIASDAGYKYVYSIKPQFPRQKKENIIIGRTVTAPDDWDIEFRLKLSGYYCWLSLPGHLKRFLSKLRDRACSLFYSKNKMFY